jgi:hypothetical protein
LLTPRSREFRLNTDRSNQAFQEEMYMLKSIRTALTVAVVTLSLGGLATSALADTDTKWQKNHPRREQVNNRLANQNKRIKNEVKQGEMSKTQAAKLHREDRAIRKEERAMASTNGGHVTKAEQKALNQQENQVSKQIGK